MDPFDLTFTDPGHPFHLHHMEMCLEEARIAADEDEVPIGALIVHPEMGVIGLAHNQREQLNDPTAHAELIAMTQAGQALKSWRLDGCILYVTLEPCPMCAGAVVNAPHADGRLRRAPTPRPARATRSSRSPPTRA